MLQSELFSYVLHAIKDSLNQNSDEKFVLVDDFSESEKVQVKILVTDIYQTTIDKSGQRIIVDEKRYEVPSQYNLHLSILFNSNNQEELLKALGYIAVFFKDNSVFSCNEYNWHGNDLNKFFLEPVIRREMKETQFLSLDYKIELQLNSTKGESFVRVEKKDIRGDLMK